MWVSQVPGPGSAVWDPLSVGCRCVLASRRPYIHLQVDAHSSRIVGYRWMGSNSVGGAAEMTGGSKSDGRWQQV